jgi:hypothetical protein
LSRELQKTPHFMLVSGGSLLFDSAPRPMNKLVYSALALSVLFSVSCNLNEQEKDGRKYYSNASPLQRGVNFKRVKTTTPEGTVATQGTATDTPEGIFKLPDTPDEPGAHYWLNSKQSANPMESKMGVRVRREKREEGKGLFE